MGASVPALPTTGASARGGLAGRLRWLWIRLMDRHRLWFRRPWPDQEGEAATNNNPKADSWEDFSYYIRCITRGVVGSIYPVVYGNGQEIVQAPGFVSIMQEMVHEARVIPLDGRPHASAKIRTYMGDPRGHWEGNTLVVETTNFLGGKTSVERPMAGALPRATR